MTIPSFILLSLTASLAAAEVSAFKSTLIFPSGESLAGSPSGVDSDGHLRWQSPLFANEEEAFFSTALDSIQIESLAPVALPEATQAIITFQSHVDRSVDSLSGELLEFNDETLKLRTWYGGDLTLRRSMISSVEVDTTSPAILNGFGRASDWQTLSNEKPWRIEKNILHSSDRGSISRPLPNLPNQIQLSFDLTFDYNPYLQIYFFADANSELNRVTGYSVNIQRSSMRFSKRKKQRSAQLENEQFEVRHEFLSDASSRIDLYLDRENGLMKLYLNEKLICAATDPEPLTEFHWLHFASPQKQEQSISNFVIRAWDGTLPKKKDYLEFREELPGEGTQIELQNGDTIIGKAQAIADGKLSIQTESISEPIAVPISRLSSFQITTYENREEPRIFKEDVRCYFPNGKYLTLRLSDISPSSITGYSQVFGEATFLLRAFSHINFNPYNEEARIRRGDPL